MFRAMSNLEMPCGELGQKFSFRVVSKAAPQKDILSDPDQAWSPHCGAVYGVHTVKKAHRLI